MKWTLLLLLAFQFACAQKATTAEEPEIFNSKYVRLVGDTSRLMLIENVVIRYGDLYVEADSALLEKPEQTVTAFGIKKARFKGNEIDKKEYTNRIRYKKGDKEFTTD